MRDDLEEGSVIAPDGDSDVNVVIRNCGKYVIRTLSDEKSSLNLWDTGGGGGCHRVETIIKEWVIKDKSEILLPFAWWWHQDDPFNIYCPEKHAWNNQLISGQYAGCMPLAIAQVMTYFEYPNPYIAEVDGRTYTINWDILKNGNVDYENYTYTSRAGKLSAAYLLRDIGIKTETMYFAEGTYTLPSKAVEYLKSVGYKNAHIVDYNFDVVKEMIDNEQPVIVYAIHNSVLKEGHCWTIDGYLTKDRICKTTIYYGGNEPTVIIDTVESYRMVHCNFGKKGSCNGYFITGVFKFNDDRVIYDGEHSNSDTSYYRDLSIIKYDKPY